MFRNAKSGLTLVCLSLDDLRRNLMVWINKQMQVRGQDTFVWHVSIVQSINQRSVVPHLGKATGVFIRSGLDDLMFPSLQWVNAATQLSKHSQMWASSLTVLAGSQPLFGLDGSNSMLDVIVQLLISNVFSLFTLTCTVRLVSKKQLDKKATCSFLVQPMMDKNMKTQQQQKFLKAKKNCGVSNWSGGTMKRNKN